jgi:hypothetical protein
MIIPDIENEMILKIHLWELIIQKIVMCEGKQRSLPDGKSADLRHKNSRTYLKD